MNARFSSIKVILASLNKRLIVNNNHVHSYTCHNDSMSGCQKDIISPATFFIILTPPSIMVVSAILINVPLDT